MSVDWDWLIAMVSSWVLVGYVGYVFGRSKRDDEWVKRLIALKRENENLLTALDLMEPRHDR